MSKNEKFSTERAAAVDPQKNLRDHYTFTFENPLVPGGTGIVRLLLTATEVRKHAQVLANVFATTVVTERNGFRFDTEPEYHTNPYYAIQQGEMFTQINSLRLARHKAQGLANESEMPVNIEHQICGKWVVIEKATPEEIEEE